jgi:L-ascorbate metabolism protein UlaG (beta-lactamase superfamily)
LIEKGDRRCLIDPGNFVEQNIGVEPEDWPKVDLLLVTHKHPDHAHRPYLKFLMERDDCPLYTNQSFAEELKTEGITAGVFKPGQTVEHASFSVRGVSQQHPDLPPDWKPGPEVVGFAVDDTFYTPGDSRTLPEMPQADVLFVPVIGPQMSIETARQMIEAVKPKLAIPMHYANVKKYPINMDELRAFHVAGTEVLVLEDKQSFTWPQE